MSDARKILADAIYDRSASDDTESVALTNLFRAALNQIHETDLDPEAIYPSDGRHMDGVRIFKISPVGRAIIDLAEVYR